MASYNRVVLIGRLTRDPEMRYTSTGLAVASFSIAVDRRTKNNDGQKQADFFRCSAWRQSAEFVNEYARKGRLVAVDGRIEINEYTAQDGTKKQSVDVQVDNFQLLDRGDEAGSGAGGSAESRGGGRDAAPAEDNGYYPDEEPAARPAPQRAARPTPAAALAEDRPARNASPAGRPAAAARGEAPTRPAAAGARKPEPMYPDDDFDDSDPFADE